jgi:hypothetical protein
LERAEFIRIIDDGRWHLYQWNLADSSKWFRFFNGDNVIGGPNSFVDSIYFSSAPSTVGGTNWSGSVWIDTVAYNPHGDLSSLVVLPGDFNNSGAVDTADYTVWRKGLGTKYTYHDYEDWRSHFGETLSSAAAVGSQPAAVPEPGAVLLVAWGIFVAGILVRQSRQK